MRDLYDKLLGYIPPGPRMHARKLARAIYFAPAEIADAIGGKASGLPPRRLRLIGGGDFVSVGNGVRDNLVTIGGLRPEDHVLDIGCGIGRVALPLTNYIDDAGHYIGFDLMSECVKWCTENISVKRSNFIFYRSDILNENYNPSGKLRASEYVFPAQADSIDFAFATSVFTHMLWPDVTHYFEETARVLKPLGKAYLTFFLLNEDRDALMGAGLTKRTFFARVGNGWASYAGNPEAAIAYREEDVVSALANSSLNLIADPLYGSWSGVQGAGVYQDVLLVQKSELC